MSSYILPSSTLPRVKDKIWFPTQPLSTQLRTLKQNEEILLKAIDHITDIKSPNPIGPPKEQNEAPAVHESTDNDPDDEESDGTDDDVAWM